MLASVVLLASVGRSGLTQAEHSSFVPPSMEWALSAQDKQYGLEGSALSSCAMRNKLLGDVVGGKPHMDEESEEDPPNKSQLNQLDGTGWKRLGFGWGKIDPVTPGLEEGKETPEEIQMRNIREMEDERQRNTLRAEMLRLEGNDASRFVLSLLQVLSFTRCRF